MRSLKKCAVSLLLAVLMTAGATELSFMGGADRLAFSKSSDAPYADDVCYELPITAAFPLSVTGEAALAEPSTINFYNRPAIGLLSAENVSSALTEDPETSSSSAASSEGEPESGTESGTESGSSSEAASSKPEETVPKVGKVTNVKYASYAANYVKLTWSAVKNGDGYIIYYRDCDKRTSFKRVAVTKNTNVTVKNLKASTYYQFKISAYKKVSGKVYEGNYAVCNTLTTLSGVGSFKLNNSSSYIQFSWGKNSRATGYQIYRIDMKTNGKWIKYKTVKGNSNITLKDTRVELGKSYYYKVRAYRTVGSKTYYSSFNIFRAVCGLSSPKISSASTTLGRLKFTWNKNKYVYGYDIYIKGEKDAKYKYLATTRNPYYTTKKLTPGTKYSLAIYPFRYVGVNKLKVRGTCSIKTVKVRNLAYGVDVGSTYIEINLKKQRMQFYVNNKLYVDTPVVTGMDNGYNNTPKGAYKIFERKSPATLYGDDYVTPVKYWLAFTYSGCGIHDATWRPASDYVVDTYKYNGSHGCVNTPYNEVKKIYDKARVGMYVVLY